ncbi:MAG: hypothetical protein O7B99_15055 [Planctomycetota bacterium]|nr:hypothetical protein [Planctomycetota bacterium]
MDGSVVEEVRADFVRLWGRLGPLWGISPATAQVFGWLLFEADGADGERISEGLGMSRGAVSMACRELFGWGLVHADRAPGSRRVIYRPETDPERVVRGVVETRKRREWDPILESVRGWLDDLRGDRSREATIARGRLEGIESLVGAVDEMAESFLRGDLLPRLGLKALTRRARSRKKRGRPRAST